MFFEKEPDLLQDVRKGNDAEILKENPLLNESFNVLKKKYCDLWMASSPDDVQGRERIYMATYCIDKVYEHLVSLISNGSIAKKELENLRKMKKGDKNGFSG